MSRYANAHSRVVAWLKVLLPLLALGVLSTLFLVSHRVNPEDAVALSGISIEDRIRQPRVTAPVWSGITDDGSSLTVTADVARPTTTGAKASGPDADRVTARLVSTGGAVTGMTGDHGKLDEAAGHLTMTGNVVVTTSSGLRLTSGELVSALNGDEVVSAGPVTGTGPFGRIDAGAMRLVKSGAANGTPAAGDPAAVDPAANEPAAGGGYLLVFKNGVKLLYQPTK